MGIGCIEESFFLAWFQSSRAFPFSVGEHPEFMCERAILFAEGAERRPFLPSLAAHEILHLYGAIDLAPGKLEEQAEPLHVAAINARAVHAFDVMHTPTARPLDQYVISCLTAYLVGWRDLPPVWVVAPVIPVSADTILSHGNVA